MVLEAAGVLVGAVWDALAGGAVPALLPVRRDGRAQAHCRPRVTLDLLQSQIEARVLHRLDEQLIHRRPQHRRRHRQPCKVHTHEGIEGEYLLPVWVTQCLPKRLACLNMQQLGVQSSLLGPQDKQATTRSGRVCKLTEHFPSMGREPLLYCLPPLIAAHPNVVNLPLKEHYCNWDSSNVNQNC